MNAMHTLNPVIESSREDTLHNVACCLAFIRRAHEDLADWNGLAEGGEVCGPDDMNSEQHRGLAILIDCVRAAVAFEAYERKDSAAQGGSDGAR